MKTVMQPVTFKLGKPPAKVLVHPSLIARINTRLKVFYLSRIHGATYKEIIRVLGFNNSDSTITVIIRGVENLIGKKTKRARYGRYGYVKKLPQW